MAPSPDHSEDEDERAGDWIGPYKLLENIGEGGFGTVWMADQREPLRRRVALKIVKLGMDTRQVVARFEQERQALALMDHPGIAKVFDAGATSRGRPYFVMELVRGQRITDYCDGENLSTAERLELFMEVCTAVQHAHQKGIIHRDLKPSNVLVTLHDTKALPKIIDFGVAKATRQERLTEMTLFTEFEQFVGTPLYMAPEQAELSGVDIDTRADLYALGVLLYELMSGRPPFETDELMKAGLDAMRKAVLEQDPVKPSTRLTRMDVATQRAVASRRHTDEQRLIKSLRGDLDCIVMKAMEKPRERRYATADALAEDLRRHLGNEPVLARPPSRYYLAERAFRRHRAAITIAAIVTLVFGFSVAGMAWQGERARQEAERTKRIIGLLHASASGYVSEAEELVASGKGGEAVEKFDRAIGLKPEDAALGLARADLLQAMLRFPEAAAAYRKLSEPAQANPRAGTNAELCDFLAEQSSTSKEVLQELFAHMKNEQRPAAEIALVRVAMRKEVERLREVWLGRLAERGFEELRTWKGPPKPLAERLTISDSLGLELDLESVRFGDLSLLKGMPLESLNVSNSMVKDLTPLRGMALERLYIGRNSVKDLTPLVGMPLQVLHCVGGSGPTDFSPLAGLPIVELNLTASNVRSLDFLEGMPVRHLMLDRCGKARGYAVLGGLETLTALQLPKHFLGMEEAEIDALGKLRHHPSLKKIESRGETIFSRYESAAGFWERYDLDRRTLQAIRSLGVPIGDLSKRLEDGTWRVKLTYQPFPADRFAGLPVSWLDLAFTGPTDLAGFEKIPLKLLAFQSVDVVDLEPLADLQLETMFLVDCLPELDVSPLARIPTLNTIYLPPRPVGLESLRELPGVLTLAYPQWGEAPQPTYTPEAFWAGKQEDREAPLLRAGDFEAAGEMLRKRMQVTDGPWMRHYVGLMAILLAQGDEDAYREACQEAIADITGAEPQMRSYWAEPLARICELGPDPGVPAPERKALVEAAAGLRKNPHRRCFHYLTAGLHAYRTGDAAGAVELLEQVESDRFHNIVRTARAGLVMAHWEAGERGQARALLSGLVASARKALEDVPDSSPYWYEPLYALLLAEEAERLLGDGGGSTKPAPSSPK